MNRLLAFARKLWPDRWGVEECYGPSVGSGGDPVDADCFISATFKTKLGARWWAWRVGGHDWGMADIKRLDQLEY